MPRASAPRSIEFRFRNRGAASPEVLGAQLSHAIPLHPWHEPRQPGHSGCWVELLAADGAILFQTAVPSLMTAQPFGGPGPQGPPPLKEFTVQVPIIDGAAALRLSASPPDARGVRHDAGGPAREIGVYPIPENPAPPLRQVVAPVLPFDVCGGGRGQVLGMTTLLSHGPPEDVFTLAILAEGFKEDQQDRFMELARRAVNALFATPPMRRALNTQNINVYAIRVASNSDKFSEPDKRYFEAKHPSGEYGTLLNWNQSCVYAVGRYFGISFDWLGLLVNESLTSYGTASNRQFALSVSSGWERTWVHEFGHSAFNLSDEYSGDQGAYSGTLSTQNLTTETEREKIPWAALIEDETPIPTLGNPPGCKYPDNRQSPVPPAKVGLFAGGRKYACDIYHSQLNCLMRDSDSEPDFCRVCYNRAIEMFIAEPRVLVPVPAIAHYSKLDEKWTTPKVAGDIYSRYGPDKNSPEFDTILEELLSGAVGPKLKARLDESHVFEAEGDPIYQGAYDPNTRAGHWYIFSSTHLKTVYLYTGTSELATLFGFVEVDLIDFPRLTEFDSVPLGIDTILYAASDGRLEMGRLDAQARLEGDGMQMQIAQGLGEEVASVSSVAIRPRAFVSVIDALEVKMGVYQFTSQSWSEQGFVTLSADAEREFHAVRSSVSGRSVAVLAAADDGLYLGIWDSRERHWTGPASAGPAAANAVTLFDVAALGTRLAAVWYDIDASRLMLSVADIEDRNWGTPIDITQAAGFPTGAVVTDIGAACLDPNLHVVAIVDGVAMHAIGDLDQNVWQTFAEVPSLTPLRNSIAALTLHADDPQLYLGLSEGQPILGDS